MQAGFPADLLPLVACPRDAGELASVEAGARWIDRATICCKGCGAAFTIDDGVLSLLDAGSPLDPESTHEMRMRDQKNVRILNGAVEWSSRHADALEVGPTIAAVDMEPGLTVLELGCGTGRYTTSLAQQAAAVVAVDFSRAGLMVLKRKMHAESRVALVQADVTRPYAAARAFDRLLSTLHSNLPGTDARRRATDLARQALSSRGCAVISMHHYNIRNLLLREPAVGRYRDSGIVRYFLTQRESARELSPFFAQVEYRFIAPRVPLIPSIGLARACASAWGLRSAFGELFLAIASEPRPRNEAAASLVPSA